MKNIAFISMGKDANKCAELLVSSIKKSNPECRTIQISTDKDEIIKNVDKKITFNFKKTLFMVNRLEVQLEIIKKYGPTIFFDTDMLVIKNLDEVFQKIQNYDFIFTLRKNDFYLTDVYNNIKFPEFTNKKISEVMPFNAGFIGASNKTPVEELINICSNLPKRFHFWYGDQVAQKKIYEMKKYKILVLNSNYNHTIKKLDEFNKEIFVYHFKGRFKKLIQPFYDQYIL